MVHTFHHATPIIQPPLDNSSSVLKLLMDAPISSDHFSQSGRGAGGPPGPPGPPSPPFRPLPVLPFAPSDPCVEPASRAPNNSLSQLNSQSTQLSVNSALNSLSYGMQD